MSTGLKWNDDAKEREKERWWGDDNLTLKKMRKLHSGLDTRMKVE